MVIGTVLLREQLLTTSAVGAVVVGFALQDTLGNLFAGLAIQIEKPFRVGQWMQVGDREGQVQEITWRATKLRTKAGQFLIVPNSVISKEPVLNYSEPTIPTRIEVEVGASYSVPPNDVKRGDARSDGQLAAGDARAGAAGGDQELRRARRSTTWRSSGSRTTPSIATARDQVRTNLWYTFRRRNIEIPYPIQIQYERDEEPIRTERHVAAAADHLAAIDLFQPLEREARQALATAASHHLFAAGEAIVRQDAEGDSMFVVLSGSARVSLEPSGQEVAVIPAGGFFGEMSMLTGDRRTATVRAMDDVTRAGDRGEGFPRAGAGRIRACSITSRRSSSTRRTGLRGGEARPPPRSPSPEAKHNFLARMRRFLTLHSRSIPPRSSRGPRRLRVTSTMMPGPCFSISSTRNDTPRSSQPC